MVNRFRLPIKLAGTFSLVYYVVTGSFFGFALFFNDFLEELTNTYFATSDIQRSDIVLFLSIGFIFHLGVIIGLIMLMKKTKRNGFLLFFVSAVLILMLQMTTIHFERFLIYFIEILIIFVMSLLFFLEVISNKNSDNQDNSLNTEHLD
ncbi:MAG: hypothetical protein CVT92_05730 [Bacteroidetes bacterium HGW-Bacteroidetes-1]|jgi:hypothetical protein|nr:MAG: hypothetical protein CVT92_05730 [Bacteroidetes bacterium HGW-Bacteroidetes-1]